MAIPIYLCMNLNETETYQSKVKYLLVDLIEQTTSFDILGIFIEDSLNNTLIDSSMDFGSSEGYQKFATFLPRKYSISLEKEEAGNYYTLTFKQGNTEICTINVYNNLSGMLEHTRSQVLTASYSVIISDMYPTIDMGGNIQEAHPILTTLATLSWNDTTDLHYYPIVLNGNNNRYKVYYKELKNSYNEMGPAVIYQGSDQKTGLGYLCVANKISPSNRQVRSISGLVGGYYYYEPEQGRPSYNYGISAARYYTDQGMTSAGFDIKTKTGSQQEVVNYNYIFGSSVEVLEKYYHNTSIQSFVTKLEDFLTSSGGSDEISSGNFPKEFALTDRGIGYFPYNSEEMLRHILDTIDEQSFDEIEAAYYLGNCSFTSSLSNLYFNQFNYQSYQKETLYLKNFDRGDITDFLTDCGYNFVDDTHPEVVDNINFTVNDDDDSALLYGAPSTYFIELLKEKFLEN